MRSHNDIILAAGGATELGRRIGVDPNNVHAWKRANSIPAAYWKAVAEAGVASLSVLAEAAADKRSPTAERAA